VPNIGSIGTNLEKKNEDVPHAGYAWDYLDPALPKFDKNGVGVKSPVTSYGTWRDQDKLPTMEICIDRSVVQGRSH